MIDDQALSREHFQIDNEPPLCHLIDLGSTNGTKVNGLRVGRVLLREGDMITAGDSAFLVHFMDDSKDPAGFRQLRGLWRADPHRVDPLRPAAEIFSQTQTRQTSGSATNVKPAGSSSPRPHADYLIEEWIGGGGMGEVFRARQLSQNRPVAIKMISTNSAIGDKASGYFRREIEVLRDLLMPSGQCHPSIVAFYEIYEVDSQFQLVMEYVDGKNALDWIDGLERPLPIASAAQIGRHLLSALEYAHSKGYVHRDVKPSNLLVYGPGPPAPREADRFRTGQEFCRDRGLTEPDPPRRRRRFDRLHLARSHPPVQRYPRARRYLLRGRDAVLPADEQVPLPGVRPAGPGSYEMILAASARPLASLSARRSRGHGTGLLKALQKQPRDRWKSARAMADALRPFASLPSSD